MTNPNEENPYTKNTKARLPETQPGEFRSDGSYVDGYKQVHYSYGNVYKCAIEDKRLTANGAFSGKHAIKGFTEEEIKNDPFLGIEPRDKITLLGHLQGKTRRQLAEELEVCEQTITTRLAKPIVKDCLKIIKETYKEDLSALTDLAIVAIKDGLTDSSIDIKLKSADKVLRANGFYDRKEVETKDSANSQMQKVLDALNVNIQIINQT